MKRRQIHSLIICFAVITMMIACTAKKFDTKGWATKMDANFPSPERGEMLNDLLANHKLVGLKYADILALLGTPDNIDSSSVSYQVEIDYGSDIDPVYTKDLYFFMSSDSIIRSYEIKEWKNE